MKLFDIIGALVVALWLGFAGFYVYQAEIDASPVAHSLSEQFAMRQGETWLVLRRADQEAGYVHQTRTRLPEGWLLEHDMFMVLDILGTTRVIKTSIKSRLNIEGYLEKFTAKMSAAGHKFSASGEFSGATLHINSTLLDEAKAQVIELPEPPRVSTGAFNQLLAAEQLKPGQRYSDKFFDPTTMKMTEVVMRYEGQETIKVYDKSYQAHHIIQMVAGQELDVYVDEHGEILIQEFPLHMVGARIPAALGRTRSASIRREVEERQKDQHDNASGIDLSTGFDLNTAMNIISGQFAPATPAETKKNAETDAPTGVNVADPKTATAPKKAAAKSPKMPTTDTK